MWGKFLGEIRTCILAIAPPVKFLYWFCHAVNCRATELEQFENKENLWKFCIKNLWKIEDRAGSAPPGDQLNSCRNDGPGGEKWHNPHNHIRHSTPLTMPGQSGDHSEHSCGKTLETRNIANRMKTFTVVSLQTFKSEGRDFSWKAGDTGKVVIWYRQKFTLDIGKGHKG